MPTPDEFISAQSLARRNGWAIAREIAPRRQFRVWGVTYTTINGIDTTVANGGPPVLFADWDAVLAFIARPRGARIVQEKLL